MRTREQIQKSIEWAVGESFSITNNQELIIELLLDIRELLANQERK